MTIAEILNAIQTELKAPKSQYNKFGQYNYRNCEDILEALKPLLKKYGAYINISDEIVQIGERYYAKATASLVIDESSIEKGHYDVHDRYVQSTAYAREPENRKGMDEAQVTGATSSYARKYALNGLFAIDDTKDADNYDNREKGAKTGTSANTQATSPAPQKTANTDATAAHADNAVRIINNELMRTGISLSAMLKSYNVKSLSDMTDEQKADALTKLKAKPDKAE